MPLPGGPSSKLGSRYELAVLVRRMLDLVTGRLDWIHVEPPGEDSIEFRLQTNTGRQEAWQVKRGIATGGHWTIAALHDVLADFGDLVAAEPDLQVVFCSEHAAPELRELSERTRAARSVDEFLDKFLKGKSWTAAWARLQEHWKTTPADTYARLSRISALTVDEVHLQESSEAILQLLFAAEPDVVRAVLGDIALGAVHKKLRREAILEQLQAQGIPSRQAGAAQTLAATTSPPVLGGVPRQDEINRVLELIRAGKNTVIISGMAGIGKSTVASQFASAWTGPICWIDCALTASETEALSAIADFLGRAFGDNSLLSTLALSADNKAAIARFAGKQLASGNCLIVWDGLDSEAATQLTHLVAEMASVMAEGVQIVTTQMQSHSLVGPSVEAFAVDRLSKTTVRRLLVSAYPDARVPHLEAADGVTQGHPYLVQLLIGARRSVDLEVALDRAAGDSGGLLEVLLKEIDYDQLRLLRTLCWLEVPFRGDHVNRLGARPETLRQLAERHLVVGTGSGWYRVHEIVDKLTRRMVPPPEATELHQRAALFLSSLEGPSWMELRAALRHAQAASMNDVIRRTASLLLMYATENGFAALAKEAAEGLVREPEGASLYYPHFILGKCARMTNDLDVALEHYKQAESCAQVQEQREIAMYERASVLCGMGRTEEGNEIFSTLMQSGDPARRSQGRVALALGLGRTGDIDTALQLVDEAVAISNSNGLVREEAEAWQCRAFVLIDADRWEDARDAAQKAHELRHLHRESAFDIYGWYHLMELAFTIETRLANRDGARQAAHGMWEFAVRAGNVDSETWAATMMCLCEESSQNDDVQLAYQRLHRLSGDVKASGKHRMLSHAALAACEWHFDKHEQAVEALAEMVAVAAEHELTPPPFLVFEGATDLTENVVRLSEGGYGLVLPLGVNQTFFYEICSRVFGRRPELARYSVVVEATMPSGRPGSGTDVRNAEAPSERVDQP